MSQLEFHANLHSEQVTYFAEVILPVPIPQTFTYRIPQKLVADVHVGSRVIVQFGRKKILTGIVDEIHEKAPTVYEAKSLLDILEHSPIMSKIQLSFLWWMADYYMSTIGEALNVALPSGLKLSSESYVQANPDFDLEASPYEFSDRELMVLESLKKQDLLTYQQIADLVNMKSIHPLIKSLIEKEAILLLEQLKDKYKPKKEKRIRLAPQFAAEKKALEDLFEQLESRPKQIDLLLRYLRAVPVHQSATSNEHGMAKSTLLEGDASPSSLKTLTRHEIFEEYEVMIPRIQPVAKDHEAAETQLTEEQQRAHDQIHEQLEEQETILLHGITGSGKTEIYIKLIRQALDNGDQVLYLLPEIALTTQIVRRLQKAFGDEVGVFHSKYSDNERAEVWQGIISGKYRLIVGVRSAIFLPFDNLSLVIVDEEYEHSYKQYDPSPRYHARDSALYLASLHHAKTILGSATPSLESYYNALHHKYGLVKLKERFGPAVLPEAFLVDMKMERKRKTLRGSFSSVLIQAMEETLNAGQQVIIFQNRRGYAPYLSCDDCGHIPKCTNCSVSLTFHLSDQTLKCHYCGYKEPVPNSCEACGSRRLRTVGFGTEKLEEELSLLFPTATIQRMDLDTTRSKFSYQRIIDDFEAGEIDILVGTQMVSKGLDFDGVTLVGILDIDRMIHFPDFRSYERTFQLITQVSGRAGRRKIKGRVIMQTSDPEHSLIQRIIGEEFEQFYESEIVERKRFFYPPFCRLIKVIIKHQEKETAEQAAQEMGATLKASLGEKRVLGPKEGLISRIRNLYIMEIMLKIEKGGINLSRVKAFMKETAETITQQKAYKSVSISFDVDPY